LLKVCPLRRYGKGHGRTFPYKVSIQPFKDSFMKRLKSYFDMLKTLLTIGLVTKPDPN
jgi:hypothetical protein